MDLMTEQETRQRQAQSIMVAERAIAAGYYGLAGCLLEAVRRRAQTALAAGEAWADVLLAEEAQARAALAARYGPLP
jgi:hypothetical protein